MEAGNPWEAYVCATARPGGFCCEIGARVTGKEHRAAHVDDVEGLERDLVAPAHHQREHSRPVSSICPPSSTTSPSPGLPLARVQLGWSWSKRRKFPRAAC